MNRTASLILAALVLVAPLAARAVPNTVAFSARIADNGKPVTGTHNFTFKFFDADTAGTELWKWSGTDTPSALAVTDGVVSYALGSENAIPSSVFNGLPVFLEVTFDGATLSPRISIQSVPYALRAGVVDLQPVVNFSSSGATTPIGTTCTNYTNGTVTITAPAAGRIVVSTSGWVFISHTLGTGDSSLAVIGSTATDCNDIAGSSPAYVPSGAATGGYPVTIAPMRVFNVGPGTYTYYMNGISFGGTQYLYYSRMVATFYPN